MDKATPKDVFQANRDRAAPLLAKLKSEGIGHMIDGKTVPSISGETFETKSPVDGAVLASVARGSAEDIDRAATAASLAFKSWRDMSAAMRKKLLHRVADAIEDNADDIAVLECIDTGQAHRFMAKAAIRAAENFRFFADKCAEARDGLNTPSEEHWNISTRVPIGPVGVITPWNTPFMLSTWKIAPALAAGCTVVHKPAEWSPVTADLLSKLAKQAGLPDGVLNTVHGMGEEAGKALTEHPAIKAIGFVGESSTGSAIMAQGAPTLKRVHFELGGKNPVIVFDDADLDRALDAVVFMIYSLNGERCTSSSRLLIQQGIADAWADFGGVVKQLDEGKLTSGDLFGTRAFLKNNYLYRMVATIGIWGNSKQEAMYPNYRVDADRQELTGANRYTLRFAPGQLPPVNAFWSLTMYELPTSLLVANPINRYLINSPMLPALKKDADGGLTLYIQNESPGKDKEPNWLPAPKGSFAMYMRLYWPKEEALDGKWTAPTLDEVK